MNRADDKVILEYFHRKLDEGPLTVPVGKDAASVPVQEMGLSGRKLKSQYEKLIRDTAEFITQELSDSKVCAGPQGVEIVMAALRTFASEFEEAEGEDPREIEV